MEIITSGRSDKVPRENTKIEAGMFGPPFSETYKRARGNNYWHFRTDLGRWTVLCKYEDLNPNSSSNVIMF